MDDNKGTRTAEREPALELPRLEPARDVELPQFLKAPEVAALLRVDRKTIYEAARRNEIPGAVRIGRALRFRRDAVLGWISKGHAGSG